MKNGIMLAAFAVLLLGSVFAIEPADPDLTGSVQDRYNFSVTSDNNVTTEGGNVTNVTVSTNASTERWVGFYGNVSGNLLLKKGDLGAALYTWTWTPAGVGEVCVSTDPAFGWATLANLASVVGIDTAWNPTVPAAVDNATGTLNESCNLNINPIGAVTGLGQQTANNAGTYNWETCAVADTGAPAAKNDYAFCVNISLGNTPAPSNQTAMYQVIAPANATATALETYFFYVELI